MTDLIPYLVVTAPNGRQEIVELREISYGIGRLPINDICLSDDPQSRITRVKHCILSREFGQWIIRDCSTNGTKICQDGQEIDIHQKEAALTSGTDILIHGWKLTFYDYNATNKPRHHKTNSSPNNHPSPNADASLLTTSNFIYNVSQATLYWQNGNHREAVECRPQLNVLLRYMAQRNLDNGGTAIVCEYQDIIEAVWEGEANHISQEVNSLVREIRKIFETYTSKDKANELLKTRRRLGYLLNITCEA